MTSRRSLVGDTLRLISDPARQERYQKNVPFVNVKQELVNQWFDDSFFPELEWFRELFTEDEWKILSEFHTFYDVRVKKLPSSYEELKNDLSWQEIVKKAAWALDALKWGEGEEPR